MGMGINIGIWLGIGTVQHGSLLNYRANSEKITADSLHGVTADDEIQSIKLWFDYMNTEFEKLYEIYT
jgi:hypothetical protein